MFIIGATRTAKCFGGYVGGVGDIVFRRHPVGDDKDLKTRGEARSGSPNYQ